MTRLWKRRRAQGRNQHRTEKQFTSEDLRMRQERIDEYAEACHDAGMVQRIAMILDYWIVAEVTITVPGQPVRHEFMAYPGWESEPALRWPTFLTRQAAEAEAHSYGGEIYTGPLWPQDAECLNTRLVHQG